MSLRTDTGLISRLGEKFVFTSVGCWEWIAKSENGQGYGVIKPTGSRRHLYAHRVMYEIMRGPIPDGLTIDHLCRNVRCCNPDHLEAVTHRVNVLRGVSLFAEQARRTHCLRGHPLSGENLYVAPRGGRRCRECIRETARARRRTNHFDARTGVHATSHVACGSPLEAARRG